MSFQPIVDYLGYLKVILLHEKHVSVAVDTLLTQVGMLDVDADLPQVVDGAVVIRRVERRLTRDDELGDHGQVRQLLDGALLHDAVVVVGVDGRHDDCLDVLRILARRRLISDGEVREAKCKSWTVTKRRP